MEPDWKAIAEKALGAAESFYLFWEEGFGTDSQAHEEYKEALEAYKRAGGSVRYEARSLGGG